MPRQKASGTKAQPVAAEYSGLTKAMGGGGCARSARRRPLTLYKREQRNGGHHA
jgi:hypothetical protein